MKNLLPRLLALVVVMAMAGAMPAAIVMAADGAAAGGDHAGEDHGGEGHEEATPSLLSFDPDLAIFSVIVFAILFAVLWKFAWGPISEGLDKRENMIAQEIADAEAANKKAAEMLAQYEAKMAASVEEAREIVAQAKADAEVSRQQILADAEAAAARERERAVSDIEAAKETALQEIAQQSIDRAVALASGIVSRELRPDDHSQLIRETMEQFPSQN